MRRWEFAFTGAKFVFAAACAVGAFAATTTSTLADGMRGRAAPPPAMQTSWSGFYFGVQSGWAFSDWDNTYTNGGGTWGVSHDTGFVGTQLGVQHQFGGVVLGVEGNWISALRDGDGDETQCPNPATRCFARFQDVLTIGPRLGFVAGHWMPYITGGYANARFADKVKLNGNTTVEGSERHGGWYIGAGAEVIVSPGWTVGLEYRHYEFDDVTYDRNSPVGAPFPSDRGVVEASLDTISARVTWRWDRPSAAPARPMK